MLHRCFYNNGSSGFKINKMKELKERIINSILDEPTGFLLGLLVATIIGAVGGAISDIIIKIVLIFAK